ncbi:thiolase family protein [Phreatobacter sp. AB_2022a]|uniref:thiolase family protein n=1 Tax=Phreatobacter sp. AB_2022a TaxID=3003134 RepID=UPI0022876811|nr:thiolase family protein [Phreatobacter sp. AB_2022a]MCZ0735638.1 thiolase family protein [Phreatobacter sp. AB_2022a]
MTDIFIAGVGMTAFGKQLDRSLKHLGAEATGLALADAGAAQRDIEAVFFGNCVQGHMEGQDMIRGEIVARAMGIERVPVINVENACATASTALHLAAAYVRSGAADIVLALGAEKMFSTDRARMFGAFDGAWDVHETEANRDILLAMGEGVAVPEGTMSTQPYSIFMDVYAAMSRAHMRTYGSTQAQLAAVAAKNHVHSTGNTLAQYRVPFTVEEVLKAAPIAYPLTLPMCSPISDGAAAAVICNATGLKRLGGGRDRAVRILASVLQTGSERQPTDYDRHVSRLGAARAYELAGVGPSEMDVAEVHDATATGEVIEVEALGLVRPGEGGLAAERGETAIGGRIPVNPSGGLECRGHPIGATGLAQVHELTLQLRGEAGGRQVAGARLGIAQNGGGIVGVEEAVTAVTILGR